jgi:hypothetical protein
MVRKLYEVMSPWYVVLTGPNELACGATILRGTPPLDKPEGLAVGQACEDG